ncbi:MAG: MBL fold metallo-hydrolase [Candidatus Bipolaricaulis sp.]|nr:MBL fold metallo-hydrolase [Candidatus Bipolaricaulis sp.]
MKKLSLALLFLLLFLWTAAVGWAAAPEVRVTYVGNAGFLVTVGDYRVLIDAMFDGFPGGYTLPANVEQALSSAQPPFDGVDLILVTHNHADHFSADMVRRHMEANPGAVLVAGRQVTEQLTVFGSRVVTLTAITGKTATTTQNGIRVEAIYLCHGIFPPGQREDVNYGYVVTIGDVSFFHTGDIDPAAIGMATFRAYSLASKRIDFAFVPYFLLGGRSADHEFIAAIGAAYVVAAHYEYTMAPLIRSAILSAYPTAVVFANDHELDSWTPPSQ